MLTPNLTPKQEEHIAHTMSSVREMGRQAATNPNTAIVAHFAIQELMKYTDTPFLMNQQQWLVFENERDFELCRLTVA